MIFKKERGRNSYLRLRPLLLLIVKEGALVAAAWDCVCGLRC